MHSDAGCGHVRTGLLALQTGRPTFGRRRAVAAEATYPEACAAPMAAVGLARAAFPLQPAARRLAQPRAPPLQAGVTAHLTPGNTARRLLYDVMAGQAAASITVGAFLTHLGLPSASAWAFPSHLFGLRGRSIASLEKTACLER